MKNTDNLIQANIDNLTSLWKRAGMPFKGYFSLNNFDYCFIPNSDWPNRLWFRQDFTASDAEEATNQLCLTSENLVVPYWDVYNSKSHEILESKGFTEKFSQVAMSMKLDKPFLEHQRLSFKLASNPDEINVWAEVYPQAFGYSISENILVHSYKDIQFYLASYQNQPVGTAILYKTNDAAGIHGVGVIPEMRRNCFAEEIMVYVLNQAIEAGSTYGTLQASAMGKGLYDKLGFKEQFTIKNYVFKQDKIN